MMTTREHEFAFPQFDVVVGDRDGHGDAIEAYTTATGGMTLRDYFAGQVLASLLVICRDDLRRNGETSPEMFARKTWEIADAMLAERTRR
jgi:hypothetical protein